jgi:hypothetical protein
MSSGWIKYESIWYGKEGITNKEEWTTNQYQSLPIKEKECCEEQEYKNGNIFLNLNDYLKPLRIFISLKENKKHYSPGPQLKHPHVGICLSNINFIKKENCMFLDKKIIQKYEYVDNIFEFKWRKEERQKFYRYGDLFIDHKNEYILFTKYVDPSKPYLVPTLININKGEIVPFKCERVYSNNPIDRFVSNELTNKYSFICNLLKINFKRR